jgi:hypothetical protein
MAQISSGWTYEPSGVKSEVTAENLNAHVNNAQLLAGAIDEQDTNSITADTDRILITKGGDIFQQTKGQFTQTINSTDIVTETLDAETITVDELSVAGKPINGDSLTPVGSITAYVALTAPVGWIICDGQSLNAVTETKYDPLWLLIGLTFGGTGKADFKVPDLRGEFIRGWSNGKTEGTPAVAIDSGRVFASKQGELLKKHQHVSGGWDVFTPDSFGSSPIITGASGDGGRYGYGRLTSNGLSDGVTDQTWVGDETRPRNLALNYIIKY